MALGLILVGALMLVSAVRNTQGDLFGLVKGDLTGGNNFIEWALAIVMVGAIGYVPRLKPFSVALLALVLVGIFVRKGNGFFTQLEKAVNATQKAT